MVRWWSPGYIFTLGRFVQSSYLSRDFTQCFRVRCIVTSLDEGLPPGTLDTLKYRHFDSHPALFRLTSYQPTPAPSAQGRGAGILPRPRVRPGTGKHQTQVPSAHDLASVASPIQPFPVSTPLTRPASLVSPAGTPNIPPVCSPADISRRRAAFGTTPRKQRLGQYVQ